MCIAVERIMIATSKSLALRILYAVLFAALAIPCDGVEVSYDLGIYSHYVWRGLTVTDDPVFQPAVSVAHASGFSLAVWGNLDLGDANDLSDEFNEVDFTLAYGWDAGLVSYEVGLIEYMFPNGFGASTRELYLTLGFDGPLSPAVSVYYDLEAVEDLYAGFSIGHALDLSGPWEINLGASFGYAGEDFAALSGGTDSGFHDWNVSAALDYSRDAFAAGVLLAYTDSLDDKVLTEQPTDLWGGFYASLSF